MFRYITAGESHGKGLVVIVDGLPAGLRLDEAAINRDLARRQSGYGRGGRMRIETDKADIISGVRRGRTIGSPVAMVIWNRDYKIDSLPDVKNPRPGHADLAGIMKYGFSEARDVLERASARETAARTAAGAAAKQVLGEFGISIFSHVVMLGGIESLVGGMKYDRIRPAAERSDLRCADAAAEKKMKKVIDEASKTGDTLGGVFEVVAEGLPPGLGSYVQWDRRLDGAIARAIMSVPAVKSVSIGEGITCAAKTGSKVHDPINYDTRKKKFIRLTNNAGGLEGGVTNGEALVVRGYMKPIATLMNALDSVEISSKRRIRAATERADVTAVPACGVVGEAVMALELTAAMTDKFGGDSIAEMTRNYKAYLKAIREV
ncbi:MAG: chorismate synthase [Candidatus Omnitrophica bacterium]|nr:chorismate synthase [Candidatus Omnitrophota bacterium]MDD4012627.1 chorismate synthase [Candidatus Omnitrophota bacterium]